jgi:hypothetical protein
VEDGEGGQRGETVGDARLRPSAVGPWQSGHARSAFDQWLNGPWAISNGARFGAVRLPRVSGRPVYPFPISPDIFQINTIAPTLKLQNTTSPKFKNLQTWRGGRSIQMEQVSFLD